MKKLTPAPQRVYDFILDYMQKYKMPPTYPEIAEGLNYSSINSAYEHVLKLRDKGYLTIYRGKSRGIVITDQTICAFCRRGD